MQGLFISVTGFWTDYKEVKMKLKGTLGRNYLFVMAFAFVVLFCNTAFHFVTGEAMRVIAALLVLIVGSCVLWVLVRAELKLFYVFTEKSLIMEVGRLPFSKPSEVEIPYEIITSFEVLTAKKVEIKGTFPGRKRPFTIQLKAVKQDEFVKQFEERLNVQGD
jgi:hypothetical protein